MHARSVLIASVLALGLALVPASGQTAATLSVAPNPAPAGKPFTLYLEGITPADCYTTFSRESVTVTGTRIDLRYTSQTLIYATDPASAVAPGPNCPIPVATMAETTGVIPTQVIANLPTFAMPALAAGKYEVWASDVPACIYSGCKVAMPAPMSAGSLTVQAQPDPAYSFTPASAPAGQLFALHLLSYGFTCATTSQNLKNNVVGDTSNLSFSTAEQTGVACPAVYMPYGPTFVIPALTAGTYQVRVNVNATSSYVSAGTLSITAGVARKGWYLKQKTVQSDAPFQMQLLKDSLPACTNFTNVSAAVYAGGITASFLVQTGKCAMVSPGPIGPILSMPALQPGAYPVHVNELTACEVNQPPCVLEKVMPMASDTLVVMKGLAVRMSALRAGAPKVDVLGNTAFFALPEGDAGTWRAELMTLDGRVLAGKSLSGAPGDHVSLPVDRARANAVSLLRLTSPAGTQRFLPIIR